MQIKIIKVLTFIICFSSLLLGTQYSADFLNINPDIRTSALADVSASYNYPFSSVFTNPANIVGGIGIEVGSTKWLADLNGNTIVICYSIGGEKANLGFGLGYASLSTEFQNVATQQNIKYSDSIISAVVGYKLFSKLGLGLTIKNYIQQLDDISNTALAIDFGSSFVTKKVVLGIVIKNIGTQLSETKEGLPIRIDFGSKFVLIGSQEDKQKINLFIEGSVSQENTVYKTAVEYVYHNVLSARIGYKFNTDIDKLTFGVGTKVKIPKINLKSVIDLSYIPYGSLGEVVKFSLGVKF